MSIDMEEYGDIDGIAVVAGVQVVGNSGCSWYPCVDEDIEMEEVPCLYVEMVNANGGVDIVMEEVEEEDVVTEEASDLMDVKVEEVVDMMKTAVKTTARLCPFFSVIFEAIYFKQASKQANAQHSDPFNPVQCLLKDKTKLSRPLASRNN